MTSNIKANFSVSYSIFLTEIERAQSEKRRPKITLTAENIISDCEQAIEIYTNHYSALTLQERCIFYDSLKGFNTQILANGDFSYFRSTHFSKDDNAKISKYAPILKKIQLEIHEERKVLRAKRILKTRSTQSRKNKPTPSVSTPDTTRDFQIGNDD